MAQPLPLQLGRLVKDSFEAGPGDYWEDKISGGYKVKDGKGNQIPIVRDAILDHLDRKKADSVSVQTSASPFAVLDAVLGTDIFGKTFSKITADRVKATIEATHPMQALRKESVVLADFLMDVERKCRFGRRMMINDMVWEDLLNQTGPPVKRVRFSDLAKASQSEVDPLADTEGLAKPVFQPRSSVNVHSPVVAQALAYLELGIREIPSHSGMEFYCLNPVNLTHYIQKLQNECITDGLDPARLYIGRRMWDEVMSSTDFLTRNCVKGAGTITEQPEFMGLKVVFTADSDYLRVEGSGRSYNSVASMGVLGRAGTPGVAGVPATPPFTTSVQRPKFLMQTLQELAKEITFDRPNLPVAGDPPPAIIADDASSVPAAETTSGTKAPEQSK